MAEDVTPAQRRADALGLLAEAALAADLDRGSAGDRYQVALHAEAGAPARCVPAPDSRASEPRAFDGTLEIADGATDVS